jgi:hypothetical protein
MFEHKTTAVDARLVFAPAPVGVDFLVLPTSATLLDVEVVALVIQVHRTFAAIAPDDGLKSSVDFDLHGTDRLAG